MRITKTLEQWCIENDDRNLLEQWDYNKNKSRPNEVGFSESRYYFWKCKNGHEWEANLNKRTRKGGSTKCPYCTHKKASKEYNLKVLYPELSNQLHKDNEIDPQKVLPGSSKRVKWQCENNHVWNATIKERVKHPRCKYCKLEKNNVKKQYPKIAKEWHPYLNYPKIPDEYLSGSKEYIWWRCSKNPHHNWKARICNRTINNRGCPYCKDERKTSFEEQAIYFYLKKLFPDAKNRYLDEKENIEIDIFIPSKQIAIEYNSMYYHKTIRDNSKRDKNKIKRLLKYYKVICIQEYEEEVIGAKYVYNKINDIKSLEDSIVKLIKIITDNYMISVDIKRDKLEILNQFIKNERKDNFTIKYPDIAKQWHKTKNLDLLPEMFTESCNEKFWWQCSKNSEHEWYTSIHNRIKLKSGCPCCSKKQASKEYNLITEYPEALNIWHPFLNDISPYQYLPHSEKSVYWLIDEEITFEKISNVTKRLEKIRK